MDYIGKTEERRAFIINAAYFGVVAALCVLAAKYLIPWLLPFVIGYAIAFALSPAVRFITKRTRLSGRIAGCGVLLLVYAAVLFLLILGGLKLAGAVGRAFAALPDFYYESLQPAILSASDFLGGIFGTLSTGAQTGSDDLLGVLLQSLQNSLVSLSGQAVGFMGTLTTRIPSFILAFLFSVMSSMLISMNYNQVAGFLARQIPEKHRELLFAVRAGVGSTVGNYLVAYLKLMALTFAELSVGLSVLRVDNAILIAAGIAVFDALPVFGTGGIMIPWVIITLLNSNLTLAVGLLILYLVIALVRGIAEPRIVGTQLGLHPLVALCAIYMGFKVMGVAGMILFPLIAHILVGLRRAGLIKLWN